MACPTASSSLAPSAAPWTLRVELVCAKICALLAKMQAAGHTRVAPVRPAGVEGEASYEQHSITSGYFARDGHRLPRAAAHRIGSDRRAPMARGLLLPDREVLL